jgi:hypothetical protein
VFQGSADLVIVKPTTVGGVGHGIGGSWPVDAYAYAWILPIAASAEVRAIDFHAQLQHAAAKEPR